MCIRFLVSFKIKVDKFLSKGTYKPHVITYSHTSWYSLTYCTSHQRQHAIAMHCRLESGFWGIVYDPCNVHHAIFLKLLYRHILPHRFPFFLSFSVTGSIFEMETDGSFQVTEEVKKSYWENGWIIIRYIYTEENYNKAHLLTSEQKRWHRTKMYFTNTNMPEHCPHK